MIVRLRDKYNRVIREKLRSDFSYSNIMQVPRLEKIVVNMGVKEGASDPKVMEGVESELMLITGQKPVVRRAKKSIAGFKLRQNAPIGCSVTLRNNIMFEFLDRLVSIALPRVKDFRGLSAKQFDGNGNFSLGLKEHIVFPEINYGKVSKVLGMNITIVTTAKTDEESKALLEAFDIPFTS